MRPAGIWLPECGYKPGVDAALRDSGVRYFFTDTHGVLHADPRPKYGVYAPIVCPGTSTPATRWRSTSTSSRTSVERSPTVGSRRASRGTATTTSSRGRDGAWATR